jgi:hypothetical protein
LGAGLSVVGGQIVYDPTSSTFLQSLNNGNSAFDTFSYITNDGHGGAAAANVQVTVTGISEGFFTGNGSFETNLAGWSSVGSVGVSSATRADWPTQGTHSARINTGGTSQANVETFLGLTNGALDGLGAGDATCASAMKTTVHLQAGQTVGFDWLFASSELWRDFQRNDFAFVSVNGSASRLIQYYDSEISPFRPHAEMGSSSLRHHFQFTAPTEGDYVIGIGASNVGDCAQQSALFVDQFLII